MRAGRPVDGVLLLDKPTGPTSNWMLQRVKRLLEARKAGHAGTLDPLANGLLPIYFGEATKFASYSSDASKVYEATVLLGLRTATGDVTGEILGKQPVRCSGQAVETILDRFRGSILQTPPMYSALKHQGEPLYRMARRGRTVFREPRRVQIDELSLLDIHDEELELRVACSKGTYIRALAEDIGAALGCGGTLKRLRRTRVGSFDVADAHTVDELEAMTEQERMSSLLPLDAGLAGFPRLCLVAKHVARMRNGQAVDLQGTGIGKGTFRLYDEDSARFLGLGEASADALRVLRLVSRTDDPLANK
jgi:tRNA pseudouridine55 synthase